MPTDQQTKSTDRVAVAADEEPVDVGEQQAPTEATEAPAWFRQKRAEKTEAVPGPAMPTTPEVPKLRQPSRHPARRKLIVEQPEDERSAFRRFVKFAATGYGFSLLLHTAVLLVLAFQYIDVVTSGLSGATELGFTLDDGESLEFDDGDSELLEAGGADAAPEEPQPLTVLEPTPDDVPLNPLEETQESDATDTENEGTSKTGTAQGDGADQVDAAPGGRKVGDNAITKGRFTVRVTSTNNKQPDQAPGENFDPGVNESYYIYIYVETDEDEDLKIQDVQGSIVEKRNDGLQPWHTLIPFHPEKRYDRGGGSLEGTDTFFYSPRSRSKIDPFILISERHYKRNSLIPVSQRKIGGETKNYAVLRVFVPGSTKVGIRDQITIECEPLGEKQEFEIVF